MSLPGGEPPPAGLLGEAEPAVYAGRMTSGGGVAVNTRGVAVMQAGQQAAVSLITDGVPAAPLAKDPGLWGAAAEEASARLGWVSAARASYALLGSLTSLADTAPRGLRQRDRPAIRLHLRDRRAGVAQLLAAAAPSTPVSTEGTP